MGLPGREDSGNSSERRFRVSLRAQGVAAMVVPLAALFVALFSIYRAQGEIGDAEQTVERAYETRAELALLRSSLRDAEVAQRAHLRPAFEAARGAVEEALGRLDRLLPGDPVGGPAAAGIRRLAGEEMRRIGALTDGIGAPTDSIALPEGGRPVITGLQDRISQLDGHEARLIAQARSGRDQTGRRLFASLILCGTLGPLGGLFVHLLLAGRLVRRLKLVDENARRLAHGLPLAPHPKGSDEIAALGRQLDDASHLLRAHERDLAESERRYRDLFDRAPIPYEETDNEGVIRRFNQAVCTLLRCTGSQLMGRSAWDFVPPEQREEFRLAMRARILAGTETGPFECEFLLEDGSQINVEIRENLIRNEAGEVTGVLRSLLDVTERNMAAVAARKVQQYAMELRNRNEQLARALDAARYATEAKSHFLASVSHELRTPLNGIIGFSELLYDEKLGPVEEGHREVLGDILSSARHLLQLINDILDLSKVEAGKMEFRPEPCQLERLVFEVRDVVRPLAEKKAITLTASVPAGLSATIDPARFKQVLYNYLSNAVKFTPEGGSVKVVVTQEGDTCFRLDVEDTGVGIAPDQVAYLFQEFQQLPNSRTAEQGTGLGLALTRQIVEAQAGTVGIRSRPGRGSVFSAVLPLHAGLPAPPE
ncbi:MAG TPA: ATP-binding protein [Candidatus Acidoferrales bacterium]|jgi:PAS domain S-box-containing protein|nr:ATP-binding protein [Candidatus Acidoferrales bacterium]